MDDTKDVVIHEGFVGIAYDVDSCLWDSTLVYIPGSYSNIPRSVIIHTIPTSRQYYKSDTLTGILRDLKELEIICETKYTIKEEAFFELATNYGEGRYDSIAGVHINSALRSASTFYFSNQFTTEETKTDYIMKTTDILHSNQEFNYRFKLNDLKLISLKVKKKNTKIKFIP